jgi:Glucose-6-phosphate dehydrogenase, NAD binding domain
MIERMVLFGASGDLTSRLLTLALAQLAEAKLLPPGFTVLGSANTDWSTLFIRGDEAEQAWRIIDPVMNAWTAGAVPCGNTQPAKHHRGRFPDVSCTCLIHRESKRHGEEEGQAEAERRRGAGAIGSSAGGGRSRPTAEDEAQGVRAGDAAAAW